MFRQPRNRRAHGARAAPALESEPCSLLSAQGTRKGSIRASWIRQSPLTDGTAQSIHARPAGLRGGRFVIPCCFRRTLHRVRGLDRQEERPSREPLAVLVAEDPPRRISVVVRSLRLKTRKWPSEKSGQGPITNATVFPVQCQIFAKLVGAVTCLAMAIQINATIGIDEHHDPIATYNGSDRGGMTLGQTHTNRRPAVARDIVGKELSGARVSQIVA